MVVVVCWHDCGVTQYQLVRNTTTGDTFAVATGGVAATTLTLVGTPSSANAFINGQGYAIYSIWLTSVSITEIDSVSMNADHSICFDNFSGSIQFDFPVGVVTNWYRATFNICSYSQGAGYFQASQGLTNYTLPIESPGNFDWWFGEPLNIQRIEFVTTRPFTGCICLCESEAYLMEDTYAYKINDGEWTSFTYTGAARNRGIIEKCIDLPTGCDVSVCLGDAFQCGNFQTIGDVGNWSTDMAAGITIEGSSVCFNGSSRDDFAYAEEIGCDIDEIVTNIRFELTISGHGTGNIQVCIQNTDLSSEVCSNPYASNGVHIFTVSNFGMNPGPKRIIIKAHSNNVTLCATLRFRILDFEAQTFACSECYHVKPINCEMKLEWDNDTNAFVS